MLARPRVIDERPRVGDIGDMHDDRIPRGTSLRREDLRDGVRIEGVRAKPVHGLGGERDKFAAPQQ